MTMPKPPTKLTTAKNSHSASHAINQVHNSYDKIAQNISNRDLNLTPSLERWMNEALPTVNLGRFGLKTPRDVILFLQSPAGESTIAERNARYAVEQDMQQNLQFEQREHALLMHRIRAALFLWFLEDKADASDKINEIIVEQNKKAIEKAKSPSTPQSSLTNNNHGPLLDWYDRALEVAENRKVSLTKENSSLHKELADVLQEMEHYASLYHSFENQFSDVETEDEFTEQLTVEDLLKEKFNKVSRQQEFVRINKTNPEPSQNNESFVSLFAMLTEHLSQHFDMNEKIVKDNGKYYLVKAGQDFSALKNNPQELQEAQIYYERSKVNIKMTATKVIHHHKATETAGHSHKIEETKKKISRNDAEILLINNQIKLIQAARASAMALLNSTQTPRPTATAGSSSVPKPSQASATQLYREQMGLLKLSLNMENITFEALESLSQSLHDSGTKTFLNKILVHLPRTGPIPFQTKQAMLQHMERFGLDATSPTTTIKNPRELENRQPTYKTPTPFDDPYK